MRLIDADIMRENLEWCKSQSGRYNDIYWDDVIERLDVQPTVDAVPVKHGRWEEPEPEGAMAWDRRAYSQCSVCKKKSYLGRVDKYCRYCGAKMDLEEQDAQTDHPGK